MNKYAILEDGQCYSIFVVLLNEDYIELSIEVLRGKTDEKNLVSIKELSNTIGTKTKNSAALARAAGVKEERTVDSCGGCGYVFPGMNIIINGHLTTLLGMSLIGGTIGGLIAIYTMRHKTKSPQFLFGLPMMILAQVILLAYWIIRTI